MDSKKQSILLVVSVVIFGGLLVVFLMGQKSLRGLPSDRQGEGEEATTVVSSPTVFVPPTLTEEEKEIIREIETYEVKITSGGFEPASLTIKPNDQVDWVNETGEAHKIKGEDWGGVEIRGERKFSQGFEKAGIYPYSCELHPEETGEIRVEEN